jgi:hypothetical protein
MPIQQADCTVIGHRDDLSPDSMKGHHMYKIMRANLQPAPAESADSARYVVIDGTIVGRIECRKQSGLNRVKDFRYSGSAYTGRTRRASLWEATVDGIGFEHAERFAIRRHLTKTKVDPVSAAQHLVEAYGKAGIALPRKLSTAA